MENSNEFRGYKPCPECKDFFDALGLSNENAERFEKHVDRLHSIVDHAIAEHGCNDFVES